MSSDVLLYGFVRETIQYIDDWDIIPFDVLSLCYSYFTAPINIFLFCGNQYGKDINLNSMLCVNMNEKKRISINVYNVETDNKYIQDDNKDIDSVNDDDKDEILYWNSSDEENQENQDNDKNKNNDTKITNGIGENKSNDATLNTDWNTIKSGYCYSNNINLPSFIVNKYSKLKNEFTGYKICGIFKCGGRMTKTFNRITNVRTILFKANDINWRRKKKTDTEIINAYYLKLPPTPIPATVECIYSNYYGLFNIYDGSKSVWRLPFDINNCDEWNWIKMENMNYTHYKGSLCIINGIDRYNEKLFICGGYSYDGNKCEILDIYNNKWQILPNLLYKVSQSGIKYDFCKNIIYVCGGSRTYSKQKNASNLCSYFDIHKMCWYKLPKTKYEHAHHPLLFINDRSPNVLYIAGNDQHSIGETEYLDLRSKKKWKKVKDDLQLNQYFDIKNVLIKRLCV